MELEVLPELDELLPRTAEEEEELEKSLIEDGCRDSIIVWKDQGIIVDGMTRYKYCVKNNIPFDTKEKDFDNLYSVKKWMITNQTARRNLKPGQKAILLAKINGEQIEKERENLSPEQAKKPTETERELAKNAHIDIKTLRNGEAVVKDGSEKLNKAVTDGEISARPASKLSQYPQKLQDKILEELDQSEESPETFIRKYIPKMGEEEVKKFVEEEADKVKADYLKKMYQASKTGLDQLENAFADHNEKISSDHAKEIRRLCQQISILENLKTSEIECDGINALDFVCPTCGKTLREVLNSLNEREEEISA